RLYLFSFFSCLSGCGLVFAQLFCRPFARQERRSVLAGDRSWLERLRVEERIIQYLSRRRATSRNCEVVLACWRNVCAIAHDSCQTTEKPVVRWARDFFLLSVPGVRRISFVRSQSGLVS